VFLFLSFVLYRVPPSAVAMSEKHAEVAYVAVNTPAKRSWKVYLIVTSLALLIAGLIIAVVYGQLPFAPVFRMASSQAVVMDESVPSAIDHFSRHLHQKLKSTGDNLFYSPFSISVALGMTLMGAKGTTKDQLAAALGLGALENSQISGSFNAIFQKYKNETSLNSANMVYTSDQMILKQNFQQSVSSRFLATVSSVNFATASEEVRVRINGEVEKATKNKIKDLIPEGGLNELTSIVLVNAVHFKGTWVNQFDPTRTIAAPFKLEDGSTRTVQMMKRKAHYRFNDLREHKARTVALDYVNSTFSMLIVLPDEDQSLSTLEDSLLTTEPLSHLFEGGREMEMMLKMPKFKLTFEDDLVRFLKQMGVSHLVTPGQADLSGVAGNAGDLHVSNIFHKSFIEVNEEGAEAAAATGVVVMLRTARLNFEEMIVDRPFLFFIFDRQNNIPIFAGKYSKPPLDNDTKGEL